MLSFNRLTDAMLSSYGMGFGRFGVSLRRITSFILSHLYTAGGSVGALILDFWH